MVVFALFNQFFRTKAIYLCTPALVLPFNYLTIIFGVFLDIFFFGETYGGLKLFGILLASFGLFSKFILLYMHQHQSKVEDNWTLLSLYICLFILLCVICSFASCWITIYFNNIYVGILTIVHLWQFGISLFFIFCSSLSNCYLLSLNDFNLWEFVISLSTLWSFG